MWVLACLHLQCLPPGVQLLLALLQPPKPPAAAAAEPAEGGAAEGAAAEGEGAEGGTAGGASGEGAADAELELPASEPLRVVLISKLLVHYLL